MVLTYIAEIKSEMFQSLKYAEAETTFLFILRCNSFVSNYNLMIFDF